MTMGVCLRDKRVCHHDKRRRVAVMCEGVSFPLSSKGLGREGEGRVEGVSS